MAPPRRPRAGSIEEGIGRALHLAQTGHLGAADEALRAVLARAPAHPGALHVRGMILHQRARTAVAIEHLERALAAAPADLDVRNNLANLYLVAVAPRTAAARWATPASARSWWTSAPPCASSSGPTSPGSW